MRTTALIAILLLPAALDAAEPDANTWVKVEGGAIEGRRWDVPFAYAPHLKRFLVLGGRVTSADAKKSRHYDVISIAPEKGAKWRNELPEFGLSWGKETGPVNAP